MDRERVKYLPAWKIRGVSYGSGKVQRIYLGYGPRRRVFRVVKEETPE